MEGVLIEVFPQHCTIGVKPKLVFKSFKYIVAISGTLGSGVGLLLNFKYLFGICIKTKCHGLNHTSLYSMSECRIQNSQCQEFLLIWSWPVWSDSLGSPFWLQCTTVIYKLRHLWIDVRLFQSRGFQVTWTFLK